MKRNKTRNNRIIIFIVIAILLLTANVYAVDVYETSDLQSVFTSATFEENKIILDKNYDLGDETLSIKSGDYEIDLNGHDIMSSQYNTIEVLGGSLKICDYSSTSGTIYTTNNNDFASPIYIEAGSLTINNGKIGDKASASDCGLYISGGTVTINNGDFAGLIHGMYVENGTVIVNNGSFKSTSKKEYNDATGVYGGDVTINNGSFNSSTYKGWGLYVENYIDAVKMTINDGIFNGTECGAEFYKEPNQILTTDFKIAINGGTFKGKSVGLILYDKSLSNLEISAGLFQAIGTADEKVGGIGIEYDSTAPDINSIIKKGSGMSPSDTSISQYTYENNKYSVLKTKDSVRIGPLKTVTTLQSTHGTIAVSKKSAIVGDEITLTVTPDKGYKLKTLTVLDKFDEMSVAVNNNKFTMPNYNVFIKAEFEKEKNTVSVEEKGEEKNGEAPKTGDNNYVELEIMALIISVLGILMLKKGEY